NEILALNLPVKMICPSHGVIWRENPVQIIETYLKWADNYQENQITLIYDSMWGSTGKMAESIARGIHQADPETTIKLYNAAKTDKNDIIKEIFKSKAILVGSATINNGLLYSISGICEMIRGLKFKNKKAAAFGSYGWSGEAVKQINNLLSSAGFTVVNEGIRTLWVPDASAETTCEEFGIAFAQSL
ncbi:MAG: flavodoxin domain-containing protein, partial [Bacillota bacterium]|nr:flavodoxin domain-containing protein [Bacillota bacterium]